MIADGVCARSVALNHKYNLISLPIYAFLSSVSMLLYHVLTCVSCDGFLKDRKKNLNILAFECIAHYEGFLFKKEKEK